VAPTSTLWTGRPLRDVGEATKSTPSEHTARMGLNRIQSWFSIAGRAQPESMSDDSKDDDHGIFRVDTIPPPDGEDDAYSAPTKVGPMADAAVKELMHAAERRAIELSQRNADKAKAAKEAAPTKPPPPVAVAPAPTFPAVEAPTSQKEAIISSRPNAVATTPPSGGPVTGRVPAPVIGPVGRTVAGPPASAAKPPSGPKPPRAPPRPDESKRAAPLPPMPAIAPPARPKDVAPIEAFPPPSSQPAVPAIAQVMAQSLADAQADAEPPPRLYDDNDELENAATLLHASAKPPRQEHTALLKSARPPVLAGVPEAAPVPRPREPIPFDRPQPPALDARAAGHGDEPPPQILIMPLVVGFLIFAIGLAFYIWAR
jgi:hypothetical protein